MKLGPLTFQWACLVCVCKSLQSARRALSSSMALTRVASDRSFLVLNMVHLRLESLTRRLEELTRRSKHRGRAGAGPLIVLVNRQGRKNKTCRGGGHAFAAECCAGTAVGQST